MLVVLERIRYLMWMIEFKCLKTNLFLFKRKLWDPFCGDCNGVIESLLHVFCDCLVAKNLWMSLVEASHYSNLFSLALHEWIYLNLFQNLGIHSLDWAALWATSCYKLW